MLDRNDGAEYIINKAFRDVVMQYIKNCNLSMGKLEIDFNMEYSSIEIKLHTSERRAGKIITIIEKL